MWSKDGEGGGRCGGRGGGRTFSGGEGYVE